MRKLLSKNPAQPAGNAQPLKAGSGPKSEPQVTDQVVGRPGQTLSERLQTQSAPADSIGTPGTASHFSVVGQSMVIEGELEAAEDLTIAGRLEGSVKHTANRLIVAITGVIKADIQAQNLIVEGRLEGDIKSRESVTLTATAQVTGNIQTARLSIADGARFNGKVTMVESESP